MTKPRGNPNLVKGMPTPNPTGSRGTRGDVGNMREVARTYGVEMIELLVAKARKGNVPAMSEVLNRGFGRPEVSIDFKVMLGKKISELSEDELLTLRERMLALSANALPVIAHHGDDGEIVNGHHVADVGDGEQAFVPVGADVDTDNEGKPDDASFYDRM
jgi:hypothetical protein